MDLPMMYNGHHGGLVEANMRNFEDFHELWQYYRGPSLSRRPVRLEPIGFDDLLNLQIALALSKDVLDFLEDQHIFSA